MITCIVQARMGSERLPHKVLKPIIGKPMILHVLDRLSKCKTIDSIILATSIDVANDPLVECVKEAGYKVFRGSEENVLQRFVDVTQQFGGDTIVRVTGDCPLIDPTIVDRVIDRFENETIDYLRLDVPQTFIRGFDVEVFSYEALLKTHKQAHEQKYLEHVTYYIYTHQDDFRVDVEQGDTFYNKNYRLCVDNKNDLELVVKIFEHFNDPFVSAKKVVEYLDDNQDLAEINKDSQQKEV